MIQTNQNFFCLIDPTKILLQNVNRKSFGNYSCRGYNAAGWGQESEQKLLNVYYKPGNAGLTVSPLIPLKGERMTLKCTVNDRGNPPFTRFHWLRGKNPVRDIVSSEWIIDPVSLYSRNNFSCYAVNNIGNGEMATLNVVAQAAPTFISKLPMYIGYLYSEPNIMLSCHIECFPKCDIYWFLDGEEISSLNERYFINTTSLAADTSTGDFESILSELVRLYFDLSKLFLKNLF